LEIVRYSNGEASLPRDLSQIPVFLTETQRDLFFSFIRPMKPSSDGAAVEHKCMQCGQIIPNISDGRRHAVSHLRIMRLRCLLCGSGSFFCSDMRLHLQYRHCEMLHTAPEGYVVPGNAVPCMTQSQARLFIEL
uniref:C2H2-type domain-containing protein n=1 Tax=Gongylonema pulchrum TaxID=637853 RepID=A0A183F0K8_9BILA